ncbi:hypothetical protein LXL04_026994 [Taraxacum kok-saghyz]
MPVMRVANIGDDNASSTYTTKRTILKLKLPSYLQWKPNEMLTSGIRNFEEMRANSIVHGSTPNNLPLGDLNKLSLSRHPTFSCSSNLKTTKSSNLPVPKNKLKLSLISLVAAAPHHHLLEGPVEAPTNSNSAVANPATDSSSVSTGLDTPPDPEIHRGPLTLSKHSKHPTGENFLVLVFKTQRLFVTVPGTHPVLPLSQNLLNGLDFPTRSANILLTPEFMFAI